MIYLRHVPVMLFVLFRFLQSYRHFLLLCCWQGSRSSTGRTWGLFVHGGSFAVSLVMHGLVSVIFPNHEGRMVHETQVRVP